MTAPRLTTFGGGREVGANCFLLELSGTRLLLDAGQHPRHAGAAALPRLPDDADPDAILITHGHMDHVGALPVAVRRYPRARIYWSRSTEMVSIRQLHNSVSVMHREIEDGEPGAALLYGRAEIDDLSWRGWPVEAGETHRVPGPGNVRITAFHTGHLLGGVGFAIESREARVLYTGDVCGHARELQPAMELPSGPVDMLVMEGTYGATPGYDAREYETEVERFADDVTRVLGRGGSVLVPSFALGRTQEMLAMLRRLMSRRRIPKAPVWISGLGRAMSEVHDKRRHDPGMFRLRWKLAAWPRVLEASDLAHLPKILETPSLLVLTSGMMVAGSMSARVAERLLADPKHAVFFVGYVDPAELGQQVLTARPGDWIEFKRGRPMTPVRTADIGRYYFSAHADRRGLLEMADELDPGQVVLVHGDPGALESLRGEMAHRRPVSVPDTGDVVTAA